MRLEGLEGRWRANHRSVSAAFLVVLAALALSAPAAGAPLQLVLPLASNQAGLLRFAREVTTRGDPLYAQFESIPRLAARFGATGRTRRLVARYLHALGATDVRIDATGLFADARIGAKRAERVFRTPLGSFAAAHAARFTA